MASIEEGPSSSLEEGGLRKRSEFGECKDDNGALLIVGSVGTGRGGKSGAMFVLENDGTATDAEEAEVMKPFPSLGLETPVTSAAAADAA